MGFRFRKSIRLGGGLRLNVSKRGIGLSAGVKGARIGIGPRGVRSTLSLPGTGLSYTTESRWAKGRRGRAGAMSKPTAQAQGPSYPFAPIPPKIQHWQLLTIAWCVAPFTLGGGPAALIAIGVLAFTIYAWRRPGRLAYAAYHKAKAAFGVRRWEQALREIDHCRQLLIDPWLAAQAAGICAAHLGDSERAALEFAQTAPGTHWDLTAGTLAVSAFLDANRADEATSLLNSLPTTPETLWLRAETHLLADRPELTVDLCKEIVGRKRNLDHFLMAVLYTQGEAYEQMGQRRKAETVWRRLYAVDPQYRDVAENLGLVRDR